MILDIERKPAELTCSYFNKEGIVEYVRIKVPMDEFFNWVSCPDNDNDKDSDWKTWDEKPVKKQRVKDATKLSKYRCEELIYNYVSADAECPLREFNLPKKYFIDIEVEVIDGFPDPDTAQNKVTAISIAGADSKTVLVLGLKELSEKECQNINDNINSHFSKFNEKWDFQYRQCPSEYDMLRDFFEKILPNKPCISGWNFFGYDWKYLLNRAARLNSDLPPKSKILVEKCSPSGMLISKRNVGNAHPGTGIPQHKLIVDYMEIYNKWDRIIKVRENSKLDYVAKMATGLEKIKYPGSFTDLYEKDFPKFVFYNAVDSILVHYIDIRLNTLIAFLKLGHVAGIEAKKAFSPIWIMEAMMNRKFLDRKQVFVSLNGEEEEQKAFEGAYVKEPVKGFHNWITCYDFASLYPNTMMQFNISPETFVGNNIEPKPGEIKVGEHTNEHGQITWRVFNNENDSIMRGILAELYGKRKETKQKYLSVNKEIDVLSKYISKERLEKV